MANLKQFTQKSDSELQELIETMSRQADSEELKFLFWCFLRHLQSKHSGQI